VLLLDFVSAAGLERIAGAGRAADRIEQESLDFHRKVRAGYLTLARRDPRRYRVIDANGTIEQIHRDIIGLVGEVLA
jgi:dTMP kinase